MRRNSVTDTTPTRDTSDSRNNNADNHSSWIQEFAEVLTSTDLSLEPRMRTSLSCDIRSRSPVLYLSPEIAQLQPRNLRYLKAFADSNNFRLSKNRTINQLQPVPTQRDHKPSMLALGMSLLLKQAGIPGAARMLSSPHRLHAGSQHIGLGQLIKMAAYSKPNAKQVVVLPNRIMITALKDNQPISGYACKMRFAGNTSILSHFDSRYFRAIGYTTGSQYIMHVCLGGGPRHRTQLWTNLSTLTNTDFKFQLYPAEQTSSNDIGLFYSSFYLDLTKEPIPWWVQEQQSDRPDTHKDIVIDNS